MNRSTIACGSSGHSVSVYGYALVGMDDYRNFPVRSYQAKKVVLQAEDLRIVRVGQLCGIFGYRIEHRLNRRVRDDVQYLRGGSLLLLTLRNVAIQVSILQCDRGLGGQQL